MSIRKNIAFMLVAASCLLYIGGHSDSANAENFFDKLQKKTNQLQEKLGKSAATAQGPKPELLGTWESQVPNNKWQMNVVWNDKEKRYEGRLVKQGAMSQAVGFAMEELVWKAVLSDNKIMEEQEYRSGPKSSFWRKGTASNISNEEFQSSAAQTKFIRVKQSAGFTPGAAPANTADAASASAPVSEWKGPPATLNAEIVGLRLGMTLKEIKAALKAHNPKARIEEQSAIIDKVKDTAYLTGLTADSGRHLPVGPADAIGVHFAPPPHDHRAIYIERFTGFADDERPLLASVRDALIKKYGQPSSVFEIADDIELFWAFDTNGKQIIDNSLRDRCGKFLSLDPLRSTGNVMFRQGIGGQRIANQGCAATVHVKMGRNQLPGGGKIRWGDQIQYMAISVIDDSQFSAMLAATRAYVDKLTHDAASKVKAPKL